MNIRKIALWIGIFCGTCGATASAGAQEKPVSADDETSPTAVSRTYIESGPFRFLKIEIPIVGNVLGGRESAEDKKESYNHVFDGWLFPLAEVSFIREGSTLYAHFVVLKIPFFGCRLLNNKGRRPAAFSNDLNPFWPPRNTLLLDQPLFSFFDTVYLYPDTVAQEGNELVHSSTSWQAKRFRCLDTPLVSLWENEQWAKGKYYRRMFLDTLLATTLGGEKGPTKFAIRILDAPNTGIISGLRYVKGEKERETRFLSVLWGSVWDSRQKGERKERSLLTAPLGVAAVWESERKKERKEWTFLRVFFCRTAMRSVEKEKQELTILGTKSTNFCLIPDRVAAPAFALWYQDRQDKNASSRQFLRLPLIGPVWASWKNEEEKRWGIFPRLFFWKKFKY